METDVKVAELKKSEVFMKLSWERFCDFEDYAYEDKESQTVGDFIREWEARLAAALAAGCEYSDTVLAHKLLAGARLHQANSWLHFYPRNFTQGSIYRSKNQISLSKTIFFPRYAKIYSARTLFGFIFAFLHLFYTFNLNSPFFFRFFSFCPHILLFSQKWYHWIGLA